MRSRAMGHLSLWATRTGRKDIVTILEQTIAEEKAADKKLTAIAESKVNPKAAWGFPQLQWDGPLQVGTSAKRGKFSRR